MSIALRLSNLVLKLPLPTQHVGTPHDFVKSGGRLVTRTIKVTQRPTFAVLDLPEVPGGWQKNGPFGGELTVLVRHVSGVSTLEEARAHFFLERGPKFAQAFEAHPDAVSTQREDRFDVVTFNSAGAGWTPGNCVQYLLLAEHEGAILLEPTHYLQFDWSSVEITKPR